MPNVLKPLTNTHRSRAPRDDASPTRPESNRTVATEPVDDSGQGLTLFVLFITAPLIVTGAVAFLALLPSWGVVALVYGIHVLVTVVVGTVVFLVLGDGKLKFISANRGPAATPSVAPQAGARDRSSKSSAIAA